MKQTLQYCMLGVAALALTACSTTSTSAKKMSKDAAMNTMTKMVSTLPMAPLGGVVCPPEELVSRPEPVRQMQCWDGSIVTNASECPTRETFECADGSLVYNQNECRAARTDVTLGELCGQEYRQEIVYYEFDKGQSAETQNTINRILDIGQYCNVENIRVVGHTDRSGSAGYNLRLSERRAKDAMDALISQGVNRTVITSSGMGETQPFIPTEDGVKEQLNRRTEVLIKLSQTGGAIN